MATRRVTYKLYPSKTQEEMLLEFTRLHCELYNAALQERHDAWKTCRVRITRFDQYMALSEVRKVRPEFKALRISAMRGTLRRVDLAFAGFYRRCNEDAERKGYPKFKSYRSFSGFTYDEKSGWKLLPGKLRIANIGTMQARGKARTIGTPKTCTIFRKSGKWYASIAFECKPKRERPDPEAGKIGIDLGLLKLVTMSNGREIKNPRYLKAMVDKLAEAQRELSRKKQGSNRYKKQLLVVQRLTEKIANRRKDFLHKITSEIVSLYNAIAIERMEIQNMTLKGGARKARLNRSIQDAAWGVIYEMLAYKCAEARSEYIEIDPRHYAPSQTCSGCGERVKKSLADRMHKCNYCGLEIDRDLNAAINIYLIAFGSGTGPCVEPLVSSSANQPSEARSYC